MSVRLLAGNKQEAVRASARFVVGPAPKWRFPRVRELWFYRELLYFLVWRDIKVRYAQTLLGGLWTIFQPLAMVVVFTYAFHRIGNIDTGATPYPVFALAGIIFWTFFSKAVTLGSDSLISNASLLTKVYCPRLLLPIGSVAGGVLDFVLSLGFFVVVAAFYGYYPTWRFVLVPLIFLVGFALVAGLVLFLSSVNVRHRDVRQGLPFLIQLVLFLTPIAYPISSRALEVLIPISAVIEAMRWALAGTAFPAPAAVTSTLVTTVAAVVLGSIYFTRVERSFADLA